jgi:hypothetical protein
MNSGYKIEVYNKLDQKELQSVDLSNAATETIQDMIKTG